MPAWIYKATRHAYNQEANNQKIKTKFLHSLMQALLPSMANLHGLNGSSAIGGPPDGEQSKKQCCEKIKKSTFKDPSVKDYIEKLLMDQIAEVFLQPNSLLHTDHVPTGQQKFTFFQQDFLWQSEEVKEKPEHGEIDIARTITASCFKDSCVNLRKVGIPKCVKDSELVWKEAFKCVFLPLLEESFYPKRSDQRWRSLSAATLVTVSLDDYMKIIGESCSISDEEFNGLLALPKWPLTKKFTALKQDFLFRIEIVEGATTEMKISALYFKDSEVFLSDVQFKCDKETRSVDLRDKLKELFTPMIEGLLHVPVLNPEPVYRSGLEV